ncbi:MAG TPA: PilZ domain-containing protein [Vicinamibacterales bacterium]
MTSARDERRVAERVESVSEHRIQRVRIRPGDGASVINASSGGVLLETHRRLLPGSVVELHVETDHQRGSMRGRVTRCAVVHVGPACMSYRGAIAFEKHLPWFAHDSGSHVSHVDQRPGGMERAAATRPIA